MTTVDERIKANMYEATIHVEKGSRSNTWDVGRNVMYRRRNKRVTMVTRSVTVRDILHDGVDYTETSMRIVVGK